jgi:hypothetical protein
MARFSQDAKAMSFVPRIIVSLSALERPFRDKISQFDLRMHIYRKLEIIAPIKLSKPIDSIFPNMDTG